MLMSSSHFEALTQPIQNYCRRARIAILPCVIEQHTRAEEPDLLYAWTLVLDD